MNDRRLTDPASLSNGDVIRFGDVPFVFSPDASATMTIISAPASSLATILFTDMASSSSLRQKLGDEQAQELVRVHNAIVRDALEASGGNEVKHTGDGIMASFTSASSALECSVAIQQGIAKHAEEHPESAFGVYIGLNAGEPIAEEEDFFGTSVDLAARICDQAEAGQILVANVVRELTAGKGFLFSDIGEVVPKGFEEPVKLWELRWRSEG
jgi:class 3 adenylate cyclase